MYFLKRVLFTKSRDHWEEVRILDRFTKTPLISIPDSPALILLSIQGLGLRNNASPLCKIRIISVP